MAFPISEALNRELTRDPNYCWLGPGTRFAVVAAVQVLDTPCAPHSVFIKVRTTYDANHTKRC